MSEQSEHPAKEVLGLNGEGPRLLATSNNGYVLAFRE
jgi:hypothetical protein